MDALLKLLSSAASFALVEDSQHVRYEEDQQYGAQPDARTSTITPAAMAVVPSTASENQHQDDNQYQHIVFPFL
jgi:hypothetical protein